MKDTDYDPHRYNPDVHYRLVMHPRGEPTVACLQDFDYYDVPAGQILSPDAWDDEADAEEGLKAYLRQQRIDELVEEKLIAMEVDRVVVERMAATEEAA